MKHVLLLDTAHSILTEKLTEKGFTVDEKPSMQRHELIDAAHLYNGIILRSRITIDKEIIDKAVNLEFIGRIGSGMESIDTKYAAAKNIACFNSPEGNRDAVGEHSIGLLLNLLNNICRANMEVKEGLWLRESNRGIEIKDRTVAIIGYGNMGSAFAARLSGFGCKVIAYDKYKFGFSSEHVNEVSMDYIFAEADILSLHIPLTSETHYLVDSAFIAKFAKPIVLINTSRGPVVKTAHLAEALINGKI